MKNTLENLKTEWSPENEIDIEKSPKCIKYKWICKNNKTHIWFSTISNRESKGRNCPHCRGLIRDTNNLLLKNPKLCKEWDYNKNKINPEEISPNCNIKFWWICKNGHSWESSANNRNRGGCGCPYCNHKLPTKENNLKILYPDVCKEWNYDKNNKFPEEYLPASNKKVNWICKYWHEWNSTISCRTKQNTNCPICYANESWSENYIFAVVGQAFKIKKLYNPEIDIYLEDLNIGIEYDGYYHKFRIENDIKKNMWAKNNLKILIRIRESYLDDLPNSENLIIIKQNGSDIKSCQGSLLKIFEILNIDKSIINFDIAAESKIKNFDLPEDIIKAWSKNNKTDINKALKTHKYLWICNDCKSEYLSEFRHRLKRNRCPYCAGQKVNETNCLYNTHPDLCKYISPDNDIDPKNITIGTRKKLKFILNSKKYYSKPINFVRCI